MEETIYKKQYVTPSITITAFNLKDVIMSSPIEQYKETVFDGGDWDDWGAGGDSLEPGGLIGE